MDQVPDSHFTWEAILEKVQRELSREFQGSHAPQVIEAAARESVGEFLRQEVRVKTFLPTLVGRLARERLREIQRAER